MGEFSPAYWPLLEAMISNLAPVTKYECLRALYLADLHWAILQAKASADMGLCSGKERKVRSQLNAKLEGDCQREYRRRRG